MSRHFAVLSGLRRRRPRIPAANKRLSLIISCKKQQKQRRSMLKGRANRARFAPPGARAVRAVGKSDLLGTVIAVSPTPAGDGIRKGHAARSRLYRGAETVSRGFYHRHRKEMRARDAYNVGINLKQCPNHWQSLERRAAKRPDVYSCRGTKPDSASRRSVGARRAGQARKASFRHVG